MNESNAPPKLVIKESCLTDLGQYSGELITVSPWPAVALSIVSAIVSGATTAIVLWWLL